MGEWWRARLNRRPWWMNLAMLVCAYIAGLYLPWDIFVKPVSHDAEAWFGVLLHGWAAKLTAPLHWFIYAAGAYGFWRMRPWMWPWAAVYVAQVAFGMFVWGLLYIGGWRGFAGGLVSAVPFAVLAAALWQAADQFRRPRSSLRERYGTWGLVTGASAGIGAAFARALAREGLAVVLTARREERLRALAGELEREHGIATRVVAADLADPQGVEHLLTSIQDLPIDVFVNNAGLGYAGRFDKQETARLQGLIQVNCVAPVVLASRLIPPMRARGRGAMIVSGSVAGHQPLPLHAIYSASKAFDLFFGEALWAELRGTGVDILVIEPGPTASEFREVAGETGEAGEPAVNVVTLSLDRLGEQPSVIPGWFNWARAQFSRLLPRSLTVLVAEPVIRGQTPAEMQ